MLNLLECPYCLCPWDILFQLLTSYTVIFSNLDPLTETYGLSFYTQYLAHWPEYFQVAESPSGEIMGYSKYYIFKLFFLV